MSLRAAKLDFLVINKKIYNGFLFSSANKCLFYFWNLTKYGSLNRFEKQKSYFLSMESRILFWARENVVVVEIAQTYFYSKLKSFFSAQYFDSNF